MDENFINEDQKNICMSGARYILVEGVAGSRKTDTLIRLGLRRYIREKRSLLFLTQVGSVTDEIRARIEAYLKISIYKQAGSNHYLTENDKGVTIEIANFDAWAHRQLEDCEWKNLFQMGSYHTHKIQVLHEFCRDQPKRIKGFCMKNGKYADEIFIDECQDFEVTRARLMLAILTLHPHVRASFAGDYMQTIFERSISDGGHPIQTFLELPDISRFRMQKCYRCPSAQLDFCNTIMAEALAQHGCHPLLATNKNIEDKPFLFTHGSVSKQYEVHQLASQLCDMLAILLRHDLTIKPSDVCFLMRKCNDQSVFEYLRTRLEIFWSARGHRNAVIHFATQHDGYRNSIQWGYAEDKTCLLSIHGDKGKGHKVVFFLGLTQKSIPDECAMFKNSELLYQSLLNVALTRSTQYLFIGFHHNLPSIYLTKISDRLDTLCYPSWEKQAMISAPSLYRQMADSLRFPAPTFTCRYRHRPLQVHRLNLLTVTEMSRRFEKAEDVLGYKPKTEMIQFGKTTSIHLPHDLYPILGHMAELMLLRILSPTQFQRDLEGWSDASKILFTEDERLLCWVHDFHLHRLMGTDILMRQVQLLHETHKHLIDHDSHLSEMLHKFSTNPSYILPRCFFTPRFREEMNSFLCSTARNEDLSFTSWWNLALLFNEIKSTQRRPFLYRYINMEMNASQMRGFRAFLENIRILSTRFSREVVFHPSHDVLAQVTDPERLETLGFINEAGLDEKYYTNGYHYGMLGNSDIFDRENDTLYEIKASHTDFSMEWLLQNSLYAGMPFRHKRDGQKSPQNLVLANVITGKLYRWKSPQSHPKTLITRLLVDQNFPQDLIDHLCRINHKKFKNHHHQSENVV